MSTLHYWNYPTEIFCGAGALDLLAQRCALAGMRRPLLVTDPGMLELPPLRAVREHLEAQGVDYALFHGLSGNPSLDEARAGAQVFADGQHDSLIALGGGSALDAAKGIALLSRDPQGLERFEWTQMLEHFPTLADYPALDLPALIAIPTTAGTGSELGREAVLTDTVQGVKKVIGHRELLARCVILDPALTTGLPAKLTAATGMDALTHAIEAYVSTAANPITDACALKAMSLISSNLRLAVRDGSDLAARENMAYAQFLAGMAFNNASLGFVHAMAHQLGGYYDLPHGVCNAVLLPHVQSFNALVCADRLRDVAHAMGADIRGFSAEEGAQAAINAIRNLAKDVEIPGGLRELGAKLSDIPVLATNALKDACGLTNPRAADQRQIEEIFRNAF